MDENGQIIKHEQFVLTIKNIFYYESDFLTEINSIAGTLGPIQEAWQVGNFLKILSVDRFDLLYGNRKKIVTRIFWLNKFKFLAGFTRALMLPER